MKNIRFLLLLLLPFMISCGETITDEVKDSAVPKDSLTLLNDSIRNDPNNLDLYHQRAKYYLSQNDLGAALADINRILAIDSSTTKYLLTGADVHFFMNKVQRADQLLKRAVELEPANVTSLLQLAQLHHYLQRYDEEVAVLDKVIDLDRRNAQAYFMRGMIAKEKGDTARAMSEMQLAVQMDPDYYTAYIQMGVISASQGSPVAVDFYRNALAVQPTSMEALYNLAMYYQDNGQPRMAVNTYLAILQLNPMHFDAHHNLGYIYTFQIDSPSVALNYLDLAIRDNPGSARGYFSRGRCFEKMGQFDKASADFVKALEIDPQFDAAAEGLDRVKK
jgi:tetratricopeptide (TPR) repeat protein